MSVRFITGDALASLRGMADESVNCCVTSPPYWGLRDYGAAGQIGLESTPEEYVGRLVEVFAEVRRVLRKDGTLWLNLGDSYASGEVGRHDQREGQRADGGNYNEKGQGTKRQRARLDAGIKPKDLVGIPWMVAFALRADGWYLRSDIIWAKPNPMPESVTDRPTKAHEYLFLLSKGSRYYYDAEAIKEPLAPASADRYGYAFGGAKSEALMEADRDGIGQRTRVVGMREAGEGRNRRTVWTVATQPFPGAHFAVMPPALVEPCILAGCPDGGTVLDPFSGAGTVALVADRLQRNAIGIEINPDYVAMAERRLRSEAPLFHGAA